MKKSNFLVVAMLALPMCAFAKSKHHHHHFKDKLPIEICFSAELEESEKRMLHVLNDLKGELSYRYEDILLVLDCLFEKVDASNKRLRELLNLPEEENIDTPNEKLWYGPKKKK